MVPDPERLSSVCRPSFERTRVARVPLSVPSRSPRTLVATRTLLAGVLRRELSSKLARLTAERLAALANPGGQDASPRRVQQSTYPTSTRLEPFDSPRVPAEERDAFDDASPASARSPLQPFVRVRSRTLRLAPEGARAAGARVARCPYRRLLVAKPRAALLGAAYSAAARASETASDAPCRTRHRGGEGQDRRRRPPVKEGGCTIRRAFCRTGARALAGFLQSRTIHEHDPRTGWTPCRRTEVALAPDGPGGVASI
jgi:hypothetical protein